MLIFWWVLKGVCLSRLCMLCVMMMYCLILCRMWWLSLWRSMVIGCWLSCCCCFSGFCRMWFMIGFVGRRFVICGWCFFCCWIILMMMILICLKCLNLWMIMWVLKVVNIVLKESRFWFWLMKKFRSFWCVNGKCFWCVIGKIWMLLRLLL